MSREISYTAIILKKQAFNEADEIITFFSREAGKVRGLAKSVKLIKSKLQNSLQNLILAEVVLAGRGHLPKIIGAQARETFRHMRQNLELMKHAFYASELVLRFTPDGQKNAELFDLFLDFLFFLNANPAKAGLALAKFKAGFLSAAGFSATAHQSLQSQAGQLRLCNELEACAFNRLEEKSWSNLEPLQKFLSEFIVYHLEREVKSEAFLKSV